jgi:DNA-binding MarR family transcriptional regulator
MKTRRASRRKNAEPVASNRPSAQPESPADNILALVHVFSNLIGRAFYGPIEARHHLSVQQWRILLTLAQHPGATAVDIIARWALQPMSVSRAIRELEQRGLIVRRIGSSDRRSQELFLTRKGQRVYDAVVPDANARYHDIVDCLPPAERARLARALLVLTANTQRLVAPDSR